MNQAHRLLGLFPSFSPTATGGVQLSARLAWEGSQVALATTTRQPWLFCYGQAPAVPIYQPGAHITYAASKTQAVWAALRQRWMAETVLIWHIDLLKLLPFFRLRKTRIVLFLHGVEAWRTQDRMTAHFLHRINLFLSNSDYTWQRFLAWQPQLSHMPHRTVHLGVEEPCVHILPQPDSTPVMLMISRLAANENYKGHREMIEVWPKVLQQTPNAQLWIVGDGDLRKDLERMVQLHRLHESIRFWGQVSEAQKKELLIQSRCLAMPSQNEGFGLVYLEAMRLGRPCLVSTVDAGREVIQPPHAGLAVDTSNPQALAEGAIELLEQGSNWKVRSQNAQQRYERYFTARHFQRRLINAIFSNKEHFISREKVSE